MESNPVVPDRPRLPLQALPRLLISRRWWWSTLFVLLGMALLARLGLWQLDRHEQRQALNVQLAAQLAQPAIPLTGAALPGDPADLRDRQAVATGRFDFSHQVAIIQQVWHDAAGIRLVAPLVLADGRHAVLVDRGWLPLDLSEADQWSQFDQPGELTINGYIELSQTAPSGREADSLPTSSELQEGWYRLDIAAIQAQMPYELLPIYLLQAPEGSNVQLPYRDAPEVDLSDGPHLGYAFQWFLFALVLATLYLAYVRQHETIPPL